MRKRSLREKAIVDITGLSSPLQAAKSTIISIKD